MKNKLYTLVDILTYYIKAHILIHTPIYTLTDNLTHTAYPNQNGISIRILSHYTMYNVFQSSVRTPWNI